MARLRVQADADKVWPETEHLAQVIRLEDRRRAQPPAPATPGAPVGHQTEPPTVEHDNDPEGG